MKDVQINIGRTDIIGASYTNNFKIKQGSNKLMIKNAFEFKFNPAAPTNAMYVVHFVASDEGENMVLKIDTMTPVSSSTYVDEFEQIVKEQYTPVIMLAVNEKVRNFASCLSLNINTPSIAFGRKKDDDAEKSDEDFYDFTK